MLHRNTWDHITVCKLFVLDRNTWYHIIECKLSVLDRDIWYHITVCKLFVLDRNTWYHITVCKLFVLDKNIWYHITVCKLFVLDRNTWYHIHHHHVVPQARISLTLSRHFLLFIASGRSSGPHHVSSHSCWMYVFAGRPAFARPYVRVHRSTSLMSSSLLLQQWPACLVRLAWIVFVMGGRWPYSWCLVGCCCLDLFNIARNILV